MLTLTRLSSRYLMNCRLDGRPDDRLSLAATIQSASGGDIAITVRLGGWCIDLQRGQVSLARALVVLQGLDQLDRQLCEPQTWQHLKVAEMAIAAYVTQSRAG